MNRLEEIFDISYGTDLELINCEEDFNGIPFISRTSNNNGMVARVKIRDDVEPKKGYCITVALGGSVLSSFFQKEDFYTSFHIACLYPKEILSEIEMLYYCAAIEKNKYKYNYGRQANKTLKNILVPSHQDIPINSRIINTNIPFNKKAFQTKDLKLNSRIWKYFYYEDIFNIISGYNDAFDTYDNGMIPYISSTGENNGLMGFVESDNIHDQNKISVNRIGTVGEAFYHEYDFCSSRDNVRVYELKNRKLNKYIGIFLVTLITREKYRFGYGRTWSTERMKKTKIKLPITENDEPDWQFMEEYIKSLSYSSSL